MNKAEITCQTDQMVSTLKQGGVVLYPTDTIWGLGCDATAEESVQNIFWLKKRNPQKSVIVLVDSLEMLQGYVKEIPDFLISYLQQVQEPTSVIYPYKSGLAPSVVAQDNTIAARVVCDDFCQSVIKKFGKPIVSTSANISGGVNPHSFSEIDKSLVDGVDFAVDYRREEKNSGLSSRLIRVNSGKIEFLR